MNVRRGPTHAGFRVMARDSACRWPPQMVASCVSVRPWCDLGGRRRLRAAFRTNNPLAADEGPVRAHALVDDEYHTRDYEPDRPRMRSERWRPRASSLSPRALGRSRCRASRARARTRRTGSSPRRRAPSTLLCRDKPPTEAEKEAILGRPLAHGATWKEHLVLTGRGFPRAAGTDSDALRGEGGPPRRHAVVPVPSCPLSATAA